VVEVRILGCLASEAMTVYEWDNQKAEKNLHKHDVLFEDAREALEDPDLTYLPDRIYDGELRHQAIGSTTNNLLDGGSHDPRH
jgi:uncharacterized DUF497 family protein